MFNGSYRSWAHVNVLCHPVPDAKAFCQSETERHTTAENYVIAKDMNRVSDAKFCISDIS